MLVLSKTLRARRMQILPRFELVDNYQHAVEALLPELAIDVEETGADVLGERNRDMNSSRRLDNSFGEGFWSLFCQQVVRCGPSLIGALDVMGDVTLDPLRRLLPPGLDL